VDVAVARIHIFKEFFIMSDFMVFSTWFRHQLEDRRLTASDVAERAHLSKASCYFYLDGRRIPDADSVAKLCAAMRIDPATVPEFERRPVGQPGHKGVTR
jgi:hypothetical protein